MSDEELVRQSIAEMIGRVAGLESAYRLLLNEIDDCTCDDALNHYKARLQRLVPKEKK